ncbi:RebB family R body protein [Pseudoalteromonas sp. MMG005]|uniref:RebB family R body protein n=1 Tax=Pseudoalteromonas sp. MMG005 TaxID=2822682 RepID=UPI001B39F7C8|nr:RebB family R body protein [Pseudoalteromonas sp. MMG005]MBQ4845138.1 RebB family R body protein [Pseudoalteromonas sp. MMG005]
MTESLYSVDIAAIAMANSIALLMENAVSNDKNAQLIQNAAVTQCCVLMVCAGAAQAAVAPKS